MGASRAASQQLEASKKAPTPVHDASNIPEKVGSPTKGPEIAAWLRTGPVLGAHKPNLSR